MATFDQLYDFVLPYLPGAETGIVDFHIRRTLREFFRRTTVWRETFEFDTALAGETYADTYQLTPSNGQVSSVLQVYLDGQQLGPVAEARRDPLASPRKPAGWHALVPHVLTLYPAPDAEYPVKVTAAITLPIGDVNEFPDSVLQAYAEPIAAGVIGAMLLMPGKPWSQSKAAPEYNRVFGGAVREIRGRLRDGGQPSHSTFIGPRFGV